MKVVYVERDARTWTSATQALRDSILTVEAAVADQDKLASVRVAQSVRHGVWRVEVTIRVGREGGRFTTGWLA